ncbi:MAG: alpha/beta hydrolase family protein, partial [Balneolaceae bacterium]
KASAPLDEPYAQEVRKTGLIYSGIFNSISGVNNLNQFNMAEKITGEYLLIHGTGDDNVHYQNAVEMVQALIDNDVQFETMYYPNLAHGISGGNARRHLWRLMSNFIMEKL